MMSLVFPKPIRERDPAFLAFVRLLPCVACGRRGADPHHLETGGTGTKGTDYSCVPLCREDHRTLHAIGRPRFEKRFEIDLDDVSARVHLGYIRAVMGWVKTVVAESALLEWVKKQEAV